MDELSTLACVGVEGSGSECTNVAVSFFRATFWFPQAHTCILAGFFEVALAFWYAYFPELWKRLFYLLPISGC